MGPPLRKPTTISSRGCETCKYAVVEGDKGDACPYFSFSTTKKGYFRCPGILGEKSSEWKNCSSVLGIFCNKCGMYYQYDNEFIDKKCQWNPNCKDPDAVFEAGRFPTRR